MVPLFWVMLLDFPYYAAGGTHQDHSWVQAYAHFMKNHLQAGVDYVFTYGPLGYFMVNAYDADLFWYKIGWELGIKLLFALTFFELVLLLPGRVPSWTACATMALVGNWLVHSWSALYVLVALINVLFLIRSDLRFSTTFAVYRTGLLAVLSLTKFTLFTFIVPALGFVVLQLLLTRQWRRVAVIASTFAVVWTGLWLVLGQEIHNVPAYVTNSLEVANGYTEAMAAGGDRNQIQLAVTSLILIGAMLIALICSSASTQGRVVQASILAFGLFVQWKAGFVRHDDGHAVIFFCSALWFPFLILAAYRDVDWTPAARVVCLSAVYFLSAAGLLLSAQHEFDPQHVWSAARKSFVTKLKAAVALPELKRRLTAEQAYRASECALPQVKAYLGDQPVDVFSYGQGAVLLNGLNWMPRPVFQSYTAYTPALLKMNRDFFARDTAPEFVLFNMEAIDNRHPLMEDGIAILELLQRYKPVRTERSVILLQKRRNPTLNGETHTPRSRSVKLNEEINVEEFTNMPAMVSIDVRYNLEGRVRKAFFKPPQLSIRIRTTDGSAHTHRFVPAMARAGFLLNPLLTNNEDILDYYAGRQRKRVTSFEIVADQRAQNCLEPMCDVAIEPFGSFHQKNTTTTKEIQRFVSIVPPW